MNLGAHSQTNVLQQSPGTVFIRNVSVANNKITTPKALNISGDNTYGTSVSYINTPIILNQTLQGGDVSLMVRDNATGTSSLYLNTWNTLPTRLWANGGSLSVQANLDTSFIKFFCGSTAYFQVTNAGGGNLSDARFKTNVSTITDAISIITQLQGVYYTMINDTTNRQQIGFVADDVKNMVPQVVVPSTDENGDEWNYMVYCRLTSLLTERIKELNSIINNNINCISYLNTTINNNINSISCLNTVLDSSVKFFNVINN